MRPDPVRADREYVVQLSDWTDEDPMRVLAKLKTQGDYYNYNKPTAVDFFQDASRMGLKAAIDKRKLWNEMSMSATDLADLSANGLSYLSNEDRNREVWGQEFKVREELGVRRNS